MRYYKCLTEAAAPVSNWRVSMIFGAIGDDFFILVIVLFLIKYYLDKKLRDLSSLSPPAAST